MKPVMFAAATAALFTSFAVNAEEMSFFDKMKDGLYAGSEISFSGGGISGLNTDETMWYDARATSEKPYSEKPLVGSVGFSNMDDDIDGRFKRLSVGSSVNNFDVELGLFQTATTTETTGASGRRYTDWDGNIDPLFPDYYECRGGQAKSFTVWQSQGVAFDSCNGQVSNSGQAMGLDAQLGYAPFEGYGLKFRGGLHYSRLKQTHVGTAITLNEGPNSTYTNYSVSSTSSSWGFGPVIGLEYETPEGLVAKVSRYSRLGGVSGTSSNAFTIGYRYRM